MYVEASRHLASGDAEPNLSSTKIALMEMRFCPFAERVRFCLSYTKLSYRTININLRNKPEWYLDNYNAGGKVPTLVVNHGKDVITESDKIIEFIDSNLVEQKNYLMNVCDVDGYGKTKVIFAKVFDFIRKVFYNFDNEPWTKDQEKIWLAALKELNDFIKGPYLFGDDVSLADFYVMPFIDRYEFLMARFLSVPLDQVTEGYPKYPEEDTLWPKIIAYRNNIRKQDWIKPVRVPMKRYAQFLESFLIEKKAIYDD